MSGYEVGASASLRALHRMPGKEGPEGELHEHDYRVEVTVERDALDGEGMVCDLDVLNSALAETVSRLQGRNLEAIRPPEANAVTVEVLSRWFHGQLAGPVAAAGGERLAVRVWETADAFGGYRAEVGSG